MNFVEAVVKSDGGSVVDLEAGPFGQVSMPTDAPAPPLGQKITLGIRPERLQAHLSKPVGPTCEGKCTSVSYLGDRSLLHVSVPGREEPLIVASTNAGEGPQHFDVGTTVWLDWRDDAFVNIRR